MVLNRTLDAVMPTYRELFARYNLTEQQWRVLRVIWTSKNVTSADLSERTLLSAPSLVSIIDRLEKKGLVSRVRSVDDRRRIYVVATSNGRALQSEVTPQVVRIQKRIRNCVSDSEWQAMEKTLKKITDGMQSAENKLVAKA
ncbi:hypothetical protein AB833_10310 [Chromatiales bacterium (ex Bugula neritina AB1)]|nr:hypothetical protein AB833_10310 [Chromatiales bacterium (ex Bugula neritina AB1)]